MHMHKTSVRELCVVVQYSFINIVFKISAVKILLAKICLAKLDLEDFSHFIPEACSLYF